MKKVIVLSAFLCISFNVYSQTKTEDIIHLMNLTKTTQVKQQILISYVNSFKSYYPEVPEDVWNMVFEEFSDEEYLKLLIPLYDKYYTQDEIKDIIEFYNSETGQKLLAVQPELLNESLNVGKEWGERVVTRIYTRLKDEGYINE